MTCNNLSPMRMLGVTRMLTGHRLTGPGYPEQSPEDVSLATRIMEEVYPDEELWEAIDRLVGYYQRGLAICPGCNWTDAHALKPHNTSCKIARFYAHVGRELPSIIRPVGGR